MATPPNNWNTNSSYNKFNGSYFKDGDIDVSGGNIVCRNGDIYLNDNKRIYAPTCSIYFTDTGFIEMPNNLHLFGEFQLDYGGTTYNVGSDLSFSKYKLTNQSYSAGTTTWTGNVSFPAGSIASTSINNTSFITLTGAQTGIIGTKGFDSNINCSASIQITSTSPTLGLRLDGVLRLGANTLTISQATLQKIQYLSNVTGDIQTGINISAKTNSANTFTVQQTFSNDIRVDGSLLLNAGTLTITNATLQKTQYLSNVTSDINTSISSLQSSINTLNTKTTGMTYTSGGVGATNFSTNLGITGGQMAVYDPAGTTFYVAPSRQFDGSGSISTDKVEEVLLQGQNQCHISIQGGGDISGNYCDFGIFYINGLALTSPRKAILHCKTTGSLSTDTLVIDSNTLQTNSLSFSGTLNSISTTVFGYLSGVSSNIQTQFSNILTSLSNKVDLSLNQVVAGSKTFSNTIIASSGVSIASGQSYTGATDTRLTSASASTTYINNDKTSGDLRINTGSTNSTTYFDNGIVQINQANSATAKFNTGTLTGGGATDYCETLSLTSGIYGCQIQGGLKQTVGDRFNICFNNNGTPVSVLSATNTGTPATNVIDATGIFRINGTNVLDNSVLIGSIQMFPFTISSTQYKLCDGQAISRTTYSVLFGLIGTTYGAGDLSTTFGLPNFSGMFIRSQGSQTINSVTYTAGAVGTPQQDSIQDHAHNGQSGLYLNTNTTTTTTNGYAAVAGLKPASSSFTNTGNMATGRISTTETRPVNHALYYYIKVL